jgi:hypothetical protein
MKKIITLLGFLSAMLYASPAYDGSMAFKNSDGSSFTGKLKGTPWFHFVVDANDKISVFNTSSGDYEYADFDNTGAHPMLVASGVKSGTTSGTHGTITSAQLSSVWQAANAANPAAQAQATLITMIQGQWYEVRDPVPAAGALAQLFSAFLDNNITGLEIQKLLPNSGPMKHDLVHLDGQKLVNDVASGNVFRIYQTFSQQSGYIEVKNYSQDANGIQLTYTSRWYANQTDATTYYNTL